MTGAEPSPVPPDQLAVLGSVLSRQTDDLSEYSAFLLSLLAGALPADRLRVERKRRFLRGSDDAPVLAVEVDIDDRRYRLARPAVGAPPVATIAHLARGVILKTETVPVDGWASRLAAVLADQAERNADMAAALSRINGFSS